ncbi:hypothetical protein [Burkholderia sp. WP9]|uniref:hypothetical protein n=1 Tax=Burkholderia sp. WP9 TaxID=1500263 RepID=UPI00115FAC71|nr:hypothetical protein [Burkholderia sp. WP9]
MFNDPKASDFNNLNVRAQGYPQGYKQILWITHPFPPLESGHKVCQTPYARRVCGERVIPGAGVTDRFFDCQQAWPFLRGAHLLRQTRVQVLNDDLLKIVGRFPGMSAEEPAALKEAA